MRDHKAVEIHERSQCSRERQEITRQQSEIKHHKTVDIYERSQGNREREGERERDERSQGNIDR